MCRKNVMSKHLGTRIRISFLDVYPHVRQRFVEAGIDANKLGADGENLHATQETRLRFIAEMKSVLGGSADLQACGEPGIASVPCVSEFDCKILGVQHMQPAFRQRRACCCAANKTELLKMKIDAHTGVCIAIGKTPKIISAESETIYDKR